MTKQEQFKGGSEKIITYWSVIKWFNDLNDLLSGEHYRSYTDLVTPDNEHVPGFKYKGYAAGAGIGKILDSIGIKYITYVKGGSGIEEKSEIYITDPKSAKLMLDILEKTGGFSANIYRTPNSSMNENNKMFANDPLSQRIR